MSNPILGIDVSKDKLDVVLRQGEGCWQATFINDSKGHAKLLSWLNKHSQRQSVHACLEATGLYAFPVAETLHAAGHKVSMVNPARTAAYAKSQLKRNKTDQLDARLIADFCRSQQPPAWTPPGPAFDRLHALVRHLEDLQDIKQAEANRLASGVREPLVLSDLHQHITFLEQQIAKVLQDIEDHVNSHPKLKQQKELIVSILGYGDLTTFRLLGEIPDLLAFENTRQLDSFVGLNPRQWQSGKQRGGTAISKMGNAHLRRALYFPALVAKRHNPIVREFCQRLEQNGKTPKQATVAAMRKLLHLAYGVLKNNMPFDPQYAQRRQSTLFVA